MIVIVELVLPFFERIFGTIQRLKSHPVKEPFAIVSTDYLVNSCKGKAVGYIRELSLQKNLNAIFKP